MAFATLFLLALAAASAWMATIVCRRAGLSPLWGLLILVPLVNLVAVWLFAFNDWPAVDGARPADGDASFD